MRIRRSLITALLITTLAVPAYAAVIIHTDINLGPPEPQYEYRPVARPGYIWSPGYWQWDGRERYWMDGYWIEQRPGYVWMPDRWDHYDNGWRFSKGHYYSGHPNPRPVIVNPGAYHDRDHDEHSRDEHGHGRGNDHDVHGAGVSNFHDNGRSNGHGPRDR